MKLHLAAIAFNERELETYVAQLKSQSFETVSEVKKSEDGTWYQALAKKTKQEATFSQVSHTLSTETAPLSQAWKKSDDHSLFSRLSFEVLRH